MDIQLSGFGILGYRSFGPDPQYLYPLSKINLLAGQNNSGKSNILKAVQRVAELCSGDSEPIGTSRIDFHQGRPSEELFIYLPLTRKILKEHDHPDLFRRFCNAFGAIDDLEPLWFPYTREKRVQQSSMPQVIERARSRKDEHDNGANCWSSLHAALYGNVSGGTFDSQLDDTMEALAGLIRAHPFQVRSIEAHRKIGEPNSEAVDLNGDGIIETLGRWDRPDYIDLNNQRKFEAVNRFVSKVVGDAHARLHVPRSGKELLVKLGNRMLPIQSLGTGIHEVIIFAVAAIAVDHSVVCIEEPEIHLHPRLQRSLLRYFQEETSNQYFITTHSAALLDAPEASIFHVRLNEHHETVVQHVPNPRAQAGICFDMGNRASDLLQANVVIWVEGPSDRVYVNSWIKKVAADLREGYHYSVLAYGGSLLAKLSAKDEPDPQFSGMLAINRNAAILVDSDRDTAAAPLKERVQRVTDEVRDSGGFVWVTAGREVENYLSAKDLQSAFAKIHTKSALPSVSSEFDCCYPECFDKVKIANEIATMGPELNVLDLYEKVSELVAFIRRTNEQVSESQLP